MADFKKELDSKTIYKLRLKSTLLKNGENPETILFKMPIVLSAAYKKMEENSRIMKVKIISNVSILQ